MPYPNVRTATKEELRKYYPHGVFGICRKCGATWPDGSLLGMMHDCKDAALNEFAESAGNILREEP